MAEKLISTIIENTYSKEDLNTRLILLKDYLEQTFFTQGKAPKEENIRAHLQSKNVSHHHLAAMESWGESFYETFNQSNAYDLLQTLEEESASLPELTLQTAIKLPPESVTRIGRWLRKNVNKQIMIKQQVNPAIIGGAVLNYQGKRIDLTLKAKISTNQEVIEERVTAYE